MAANTTALADPSLNALKCKTWVLKVYIHCQGCATTVKKVLNAIYGIYSVSVEQNKVTVVCIVEVETLIKKLKKQGKHAEIWNDKAAPKQKEDPKLNTQNNSRTGQPNAGNILPENLTTGQGFWIENNMVGENAGGVGARNNKNKAKDGDNYSNSGPPSSNGAEVLEFRMEGYHKCLTISPVNASQYTVVNPAENMHLSTMLGPNHISNIQAETRPPHLTTLVMKMLGDVPSCDHSEL